MRSKKQQRIFDNYAAAALQALIAKSPIYDMKGEVGIKVTEEELREIKQGLVRTALEYACWMIKERPDSISYLKNMNIVYPEGVYDYTLEKSDDETKR